MLGEVRTSWESDPPASLRHAVARCEGLLATGEEAERACAAAIAVEDTSLRPFELARTCLAYGQRLRRERPRTEARLQLRAALETFDLLGAAPEHRRRGAGSPLWHECPRSAHAEVLESEAILTGYGGRKRRLLVQVLDPAT